jgi:hypothetical protein
VPAHSACDHAIVRVVPRVEREEFVNVGVILHAPSRGFLGCRLAIGDRAVEARIAALAPALDLVAVARHLEAFRAICAGETGAGPIAALPIAERFHWLVAPRSTILQTSPVHGGVCDDPAAALAAIYTRQVR